MKHFDRERISAMLIGLTILLPFALTFAEHTSLGDETSQRAAGNDYFPPPESKGGWRKLDDPQDVRRIVGMDPAKLDELKQWLLKSDKRNFAAVVIRRGHIVLQVERGNSSKTDSRRVASVSKAICATVLAVASEQSQGGLMPKKMKFGDPAGVPRIIEFSPTVL